ncbi:23S rRNA (guanosine(2251)-2'-O)-methyltransferase RlmB [Geothrix sp. PMB-07]|uniref:23S rRNA (guanosine(2251)-2'-O)-methyltransferase RlmB n=1 Tax=Geothrix sp. PMB-07 TaxID=3068640 RepID=UPI00274090C9|nr:23S rRNA (guanosine(2251)-2'-O)-methyltransferase RlmB [Geothrix sp. PMB-07]WLT31346.1 23S rRNA (guanosine(2251)-2'-O)-methyltransferase RlmB [Geothrix sp. PMB-07]
MRFLGPHACEEAVARGELHSLWVAPAAFGRVAKLISEARAAGVVIHREPMESLDRRAQGQRHQGVLGEGGPFAYAAFEDVAAAVRMKGDAALLLALDGVTDPHNLGAILRSAAAAAVDGVILPERRSAAVNETVVRASAGTAGRVPVCRVVNLGRALDDLKEAGAWIYGLAAGEGSRDYLEEPFDRATVLVMGAEGEGLHLKIQERCDGLLHIPMPGGIESLNVSAAAAITLFRVLARRGDGSREVSS